MKVDGDLFIFRDGLLKQIRTLLLVTRRFVTDLLEPLKRLLFRSVNCIPRDELEHRIAESTTDLRMEKCKLETELAKRILDEMALRESETLIREVANSAPVGIWITDAAKRVSFLNATSLAFAGRSSADLLGDNWTDLLHPEDVERVFSAYSTAVERRVAFRAECRLRRADGQYRWMLNTGVPRFVNGLFVGYIGTISDTTDLKRNYEETVATQKFESLGVLAAGIAHDFNNILSAVFAESDLALAEIPPNTLAAESIERIKTVAVRASEIVKLLQTYAGGTEVSMEEVDFSDIVEDVIRHLRGEISPKATLHTSLAKGLRLWANAEQIRLAVSNLMMNASEALEGREGSIDVGTSRVHLSEAMVRLYSGRLRAGDYLRLSVRDTGHGVLEHARVKIFDPFYSTKFLGRGMGLAVVQGILRSHRGGIGLVAAPGAGATFEVLFPCFREHSESTRVETHSIHTIDKLPYSGALALSRS